MGGASALGQVGAACFGIAVGYLTYRTLVRIAVNASIFVLAAVVGAIGGAAVTGLFAPGTSVFAWYSIGLLAGMALFFVISGKLNGLQHLTTVMSVRTEVPTNSHSSEQGPSPAAGQPDAGRGSCVGGHQGSWWRWRPVSKQDPPGQGVRSRRLGPSEHGASIATVRNSANASLTPR